MKQGPQDALRRLGTSCGPNDLKYVRGTSGIFSYNAASTQTGKGNKLPVSVLTFMGNRQMAG